MKAKNISVMAVLLVCVGLIVAGCETYGQSAGMGALVGGATGAIIGNQSHHRAAEGALIGAGVGALTGLVVKDIKVHQARNREATAQQYNYNPNQGEVLNFEDASVLPSTARRGNLVEGSVQYALLGTGKGTTVMETRTLMKGENVLSDLSSKQFQRVDGTWVSTIQFKIPTNIEPGVYTLLQTVTTAKGSRISYRTQFNVT